MSAYDQLYQRAFYYDVVFNRDVNREVDFVLAAADHYGVKQARSVLDIACGPGYHALALARRGIGAVGLDLQPEMLDIAGQRAEKEGLEVTWLQADMRNFSLPEPVDVAITLCNGVSVLRTNADFIQHLRSVAENLKPGGLYIVDLINPRTCSYEDYGKYLYSGRNNGIAVNIQWGVNNPRFNRLTGVAYVEIDIRINNQGLEQVIRDSAYERLVLPQELCLLAELEGSLEVAGWHGDYNLAQPYDDSPKSDYLIGVLKKKT